MKEGKLIVAARHGDTKSMRELLERGEDVNQQDEQGWAPLSWAAGRGDAAMVALLLERGADVKLTGRDRRTPLTIARAAGRQEVVALLTAAEIEAGTWVDPRQATPYCRAYYRKQMRRFARWPGHLAQPRDAANGQAEPPPDDDEIVYLHQDLTVTKSMWHAEDVIFSQPTPEWREFCERELGFAIPEDLL